MTASPATGLSAAVTAITWYFRNGRTDIDPCGSASSFGAGPSARSPEVALARANTKVTDRYGGTHLGRSVGLLSPPHGAHYEAPW